MSHDPKKTLLVLGATSAVAHAYLRLAAHEEWFATYVLVARNAGNLELVHQDIAARSGQKVISIVADLSSVTSGAALIDQVLNATQQIDECLLAYGLLESNSVEAVLETNLVSAAVWLEALAAHFERQAHGQLVAIGSVAGDRGRQSNYVYGASKVGLERICEGLSHRFADHNQIHFCCLKPGFIETPMTAHLDRSGWLWSRPDQIAKQIRRAVQARRARVYAPWWWRYIMLGVRLLPMPLFHKSKL